MTASSSGPGAPDPIPQSGPAPHAPPHSHVDPRPQGSAARAQAEAGRLTSEAQDELRREGEQAREKSAGLAERAKEHAGRLVDDAKTKAQAAFDERKQGLAQDVDDFAHALRQSAGDLEDRNKAFVARYLEQAASSIEQIADTLQRQDVRDLVRHTEDFARRQPGLFIGGTVLAGFALARFLKSSSDRREWEERGPAQAGSYGGGPAPAATPPHSSSVREGSSDVDR